MLVSNKIKTPDGTIIHSRHRWDFQVHTDALNDVLYSVDGGLSYLKRGYSVVGAPYEELSCEHTEPFEYVRTQFEWGRLKTIKELEDDDSDIYSHVYIPLCELSDSHIEAILRTCKLDGHILDLFKQEQAWRERTDKLLEKLDV